MRRQNGGEADEIVTGHVDSDYAGCADSRKSIAGYVFTSYGGSII